MPRAPQSRGRLATPSTAAKFLFVLVAVLLPAAVAAAETRPAMEISARLLSHPTDGATRVAAMASAVIGEGERGMLLLEAGVVSEADAAPRCAVNSFAARPLELTGPGYRWRIQVALDDVRGDEYDLRVSWERQGTLPGGGDAADSGESGLTMRSGERRQLDSADFEPLAGDASCAFEGLTVEIEPRLRIDDPRLAGRDLRFEFWFVRTSGGEREESTQLVVTAAQGETVNVPVEPLTTELALSAATTGRLRSGGRATWSGWLEDRETAAIRLSAVIQHRFDPGEVSVSSGEGSKLYRARLGETVEIELPPLYASIVVLTESLGLVGEPAPGVTVDGETTKLELWRLTGETKYSLVLRVSEAG